MFITMCNTQGKLKDGSFLYEYPAICLHKKRPSRKNDHFGSLTDISAFGKNWSFYAKLAGLFTETGLDCAARSRRKRH
jgi:hypothetical protein